MGRERENAAASLPIVCWRAFDGPGDAADLEHLEGETPRVENGELTSGGRSTIGVPFSGRAARVECALHSRRRDTVFGLRLRATGDQGYDLRVNLVENRLELLERDGADASPVTGVAIPVPEDIADFHAFLVVDDTGEDLVCRLLDLDITLKASDGGQAFANRFAGTSGVLLTGIGVEGASCRVLRVWSEVPEWDGRRHVEPAWGAQHIWTKVTQRHVGRRDRTYWGWTTVWGAVQVQWYDHGEGRFGPIDTIYRHPGKVRWAYDDHHPPGIYVHDDGHVWAWIQSHKSADPFILLRSERPEDVSAWRPPVDMNAYPDAEKGGVYPRAHRLSNGDVVLFHRVGGSGDGEWYVRRSTDDGDTWDCTKILDNSEGHVYQFVRQDPNDPDRFVLVGNHKDVTTTPNSWRRIYVWETVDGGRTFRTLTDRRPIPIPAKRTDLEPVFTDATHQLFATAQAIRPDGTPLILAGYRDDPDHATVCLSHRNGEWVMTTIAPNLTWPGSGSYKENVWRPSGGDVNPRDTNEITLSLAVGGVHEIQRWRTDDDGRTWHKVADLTRGSRVKNFRPRYVENGHPEDWNLMWHSGEFYGTTEVAGGGRHFDRFDDVMLVNERVAGMRR